MHITSTDISEDSFAALGDLFGGGRFRYAVSFHGFADDDVTHDILVGGNESLVFRDGVAEIIRGLGAWARPARQNGRFLTAITEFTTQAVAGGW